LDRIVFKDPARFAHLRSLARTYDPITRDVTRSQVRLKALFRSRGISTDRSVYGKTTREAWLGKLPVAYRPSAQLHWEQYDQLVALKRNANDQLLSESHRFPISRVLETCPGFGPIRVALTIPVIVSPHRFRTARQLWSYSGLGIIMRTSSDWKRQEGQWVRAPQQKTRGLTRAFNRTLKYVFKGAATTVITRHPGSPLHADYQRLLGAGTKPSLAKLTVARKIAATLLAMWKNEEEYDPERHRQQSLTHA
jgi:transposase